MQEVSGWQRLAIAVVELAARDYRNAIKQARKTGKNPVGVRSIERFFKSDYGDLLTFGHGEEVLRKLKQESEQEYEQERGTSK